MKDEEIDDSNLPDGDIACFRTAQRIDLLILKRAEERRGFACH